MTGAPVEPAGPRRRGAPRGHGISARWWIAAAAVVIAAIAVIAFVSYGHLGPSGTPAQKMTSWVAASGFSQNVGSLHDDGVHLGDVLTQHKGTGAVHTVCGVMSVDAQTGNTKLPSPDTSLNQLLARAYGLEYDAATDCYNAGADNAKLLAKSAHERAQAQRLFVAALARIAVVDGRTVSTTTTTSPTTTTASIFG
ncbi:MAG TPA: hypothetical protein VHX40_01070 [Acidimicrobiales bacterium]|jgi:hypothetical protein|nr:hypothetical protein [Acidimicrobiales bacterium]